MRDDFPNTVKDELAKRVGFVCSNPACRQSTSGPQDGPLGTVNIGVAAHVTAASEGGPRYDSTISVGARAGVGNGIWLCQTCAHLIDSDEAHYTVSKLNEWKSDAETAAARALEHRRAPSAGSEGVFRQAERLMPSLIAEMRTDVRGDGTGLVREFWVLPTAGVVVNSSKDRFRYHESEHPDLGNQISWLEDEALVRDVTPGNAPVFRFTSEFYDWLRGSD